MPKDADAAALAKMFKQESRGKLRQNPKGAAKDAGASDELANFFGGLQPEEIDVLSRTHDKMKELDVTGKAGGATVTFL